MTEHHLDEGMMALAIGQASAAASAGDVPVGAIVARGEDVLAGAGNAREQESDPTAHAEILALRGASAAAGTWHLEGCTMYVTLEPCAMCAGALVLSRINRLVFGAADPKAGFAGSLGDLVRDPRLNHSIDVVGGVLERECGEVLTAFFAERR
ncbi:MAG: tRNA adenosine(34) deaminase TadA [Actinobacteria bacterium]|nr:tRNA adenosine(34) deaminase TadA [Actinomycetota bacterium]